jgi:hypothetical protein
MFFQKNCKNTQRRDIIDITKIEDEIKHWTNLQKQMVIISKPSSSDIHKHVYQPEEDQPEEDQQSKNLQQQEKRHEQKIPFDSFDVVRQDIETLTMENSNENTHKELTTNDSITQETNIVQKQQDTVNETNMVQHESNTQEHQHTTEPVTTEVQKIRQRNRKDN